MSDLDLFYGKVKFGYSGFLWENLVKTVDFSETIAACDLKVGRCRPLIEIMKVCEIVSIEGQGHFFTIYFPGFVCFLLY